MDAVEFLTAIVEASVGLLGFTGVVVALGRSPGSSWSAPDRTRIINLLGWGAITLGSALLSLALISAELQPELVWHVSSLAWLACAVAFITWISVRVFQDRPYPFSVVVYIVITYTSIIIAAVLQLGNVAQWSAFWPHFSALAVGLGLGLSQFIRFLWFRMSA
jgi:hypothetical protein